MKIIQKRKVWFSVAIILAIASIAFLSIWHLKFGIDFTGGSLQELTFSANRPSVTDVQDKLSSLDLGGLIVQPVGKSSLMKYEFEPNVLSVLVLLFVPLLVVKSKLL